MVVAQVPASIRTLTDAFIAELESTLGDRFVGIFQYGAAFFPPSPVSDFDAHVIVSEPFTDADRVRVQAMIKRMASIPGGDDLDVWYVTLDSIASADDPQTELRPGYRDGAWALHRAHVHAGRYVHTKGPDPREIVPVPTWDEIDGSLQSELDFALESDAHAYAVLNLCRILYSYETRDVVTGKFQTAMWALAALDVDHHPLIRQSVDAYANKTYKVDDEIGAFCEHMRERIARTRALV